MFIVATRNIDYYVDENQESSNAGEGEKTFFEGKKMIGIHRPPTIDRAVTTGDVAYYHDKIVRLLLDHPDVDRNIAETVCCC